MRPNRVSIPSCRSWCHTCVEVQTQYFLLIATTSGFDSSHAAKRISPPKIKTNMVIRASLMAAGELCTFKHLSYFPDAPLDHGSPFWLFEIFWPIIQASEQH